MKYADCSPMGEIDASDVFPTNRPGLKSHSRHSRCLLLRQKEVAGTTHDEFPLQKQLISAAAAVVSTRQHNCCMNFGFGRHNIFVADEEGEEASTPCSLGLSFAAEKDGDPVTSKKSAKTG